MKSQESTVALISRLVSDVEQRAQVFTAAAEKEKFGYSYSEAHASLVLLIARVLDGKKLPFGLVSYHVSMRGGLDSDACEASVKVVVQGAQYHEVSEGSGPIGALDAALRLALHERFPQLANVHLVDYSVKLVGERVGADSKTIVSIDFSDGTDSWEVTGVGRNLVKASLLALIDGYEYALLPTMSKI